MIVLLNTSIRRKYCTIKLQINNTHKATFDCLKSDSMSEILVKAADAFTLAEREEKLTLFKLFSNPELLNDMKQDIEKKFKQENQENKKSKKVENFFSISNITKDGISNKFPNDYQIRMNDIVVGHFQHNREDGLSECLKKASKNISDEDNANLFIKKNFYNEQQKNKPK